MSLQKKLSKWLGDNVSIYKTPKEVTLYDFSIDWDASHFTGTFKISLDGIEIPDEFTLNLGLNGKVSYFMPMFHSPCNTPRSFAAVNITAKTEDAIKKGLSQAFPSFKPCGLDRDSKELITAHWPIEARCFFENDLNKIKEMITKEYSVTIEI